MVYLGDFHMYGYIYLTTCVVNGKIYVGQHKCCEFDYHYYGSGKALKNAIKKYGISNFTCQLIESCASKEILDEREIYWIEHYKSRDPKIGYNITVGGGGVGGYECSEELKEHFRETTRQYNLSLPPEYYKKVGEHKVGNKMMNKDGKCIRVHPQDFEKYLNDGWVFGGLKRNVDKRGEKNPAFGKSYVKGRVWIYKGDNRLYILKEEYPTYEKDGWLRGMKDTEYRGRDNRLSR